MRAIRGREAAREAASLQGVLPDCFPALPPWTDLHGCPLGSRNRHREATPSGPAIHPGPALPPCPLLDQENTITSSLLTATTTTAGLDGSGLALLAVLGFLAWRLALIGLFPHAPHKPCKGSGKHWARGNFRPAEAARAPAGGCGSVGGCGTGPGSRTAFDERGLATRAEAGRHRASPPSRSPARQDDGHHHARKNFGYAH